MNQNKITIAINPNQNKKGPAQLEGMIALKKIENYSYALTDQIGLGYSSKVYRGKNDLNNEIVAIKVIDMRKEDELSREFANQEINILQMIKIGSHQNLLLLYDVFKTKNNLYIITQFCEGKDVAKLLRKKKKLTQIQAQSILKQLLNAYRQLYQFSIVHRDLKLANVFIKKGVVKLADFGFAINSQRCSQKFEYNVGSPYYMPPESLKFNRYSFKSDVWSLGVIAFQMVYGKLPWKEKVETVLFEKITNTSVQELFDQQVQISDLYKNFIVSCLQIDFDRRASPQFLISYEWPLAQDYVEGVQPEISGAFKPLSMAKLPISQGPTPQKHFGTATQIEEQTKKYTKVNHQISLPTSIPNHHSRDKSPANRAEFNKTANIFEQPKYKTTFRQSHNSRPYQNLISEPPFLRNRESNNYFQGPNQSNQPQFCILSQIHFCRFMSNLFDLLDEFSIPEGYILKSELANKILGKYEMLLRIADGENILNLEGYNEYRNTDKWYFLREIIDKYDKKYKEKYPIQYRSDINQQVLSNSIKNLKLNISSNFVILQELTYYYQLKQLERRQSPLSFATNSKLELLCSRKPLKRLDQAPNSLCQRLNNRLSLLGF